MKILFQAVINRRNASVLATASLADLLALCVDAISKSSVLGVEKILFIIFTCYFYARPDTAPNNSWDVVPVGAPGDPVASEVAVSRQLIPFISIQSLNGSVMSCRIHLALVVGLKKLGLLNSVRLIHKFCSHFKENQRGFHYANISYYRGVRCFVNMIFFSHLSIADPSRMLCHQSLEAFKELPLT